MTSNTPDWKEKAFADFLASEARNEAIIRKRRAERGEVSLELVRSDNDQAAADPTFQEEVSRVGAALKARSVPYLQTAITFDSVSAHGYPLAEFIVAIKELGPPAIAAIATAAGAWVQARYGRKARVKIGDLEAEARTIGEIEELLKLAAKYRDDQAEDDK